MSSPNTNPCPTIVCSFQPATNHKPNRVKVKPSGSPAYFAHWYFSLGPKENFLSAAVDYFEKHGYNNWYNIKHGILPDGSYVFMYVGE